MFSIDNHDFNIIEVDGVNSKPLNVDSIQIFAGQRYSAVVSLIETLAAVFSHYRLVLVERKPTRR